MRYWDVFHIATLEAERSLTSEAVRQSIARGSLGPDDLVRPAGESSWTKISESPEFGRLANAPTKVEAELEPPPPPPPPPPPTPTPAQFAPPSVEQEFEVFVEDRGQSDFEIDPDAFASIDRASLRKVESDSEAQLEFISEPEDTPKAQPVASSQKPSSAVAIPISFDEVIERPDHNEIDDPIREIHFDDPDPQDEDDEAAEFTLSRNKAETVEELDLAAMVDVAFQLVLFFLVTAQVVLFKTLEIPKPNEDKPPEAATQSRAKTVDELEKDYILVEVDAAGTIKIDRQPVPAQRSVLVEKLRKTREDTQRKAMLLSADFATRHEHAVLVFDVANEIDLKIAIAQPAAKQ